ncbi:MAG: hypothetical protein NC320_03055 [Clostridium sp.]|nr:hypothetical protein [Clostridium sp.]
MKIVKRKRSIKSSARIVAADENYDTDDYDFSETIDDLADDVEDIQDSIDDIQEDDVDIELDNNIGNHYIAECDNCHGIFISALTESDQDVEKISGTCPLCDKETDQYLKWVIKDI